MFAKRLKVDSNVHHFSRDSFDRFGDDLTEVLLQYLKLSDKLRLESVSKQWKRCIYQKDFVVQIEGYKIENQDTLNKLYVKNKVKAVRVRR